MLIIDSWILLTQVISDSFKRVIHASLQPKLNEVSVKHCVKNKAALDPRTENVIAESVRGFAATGLAYFLNGDVVCQRPAVFRALKKDGFPS